VIPSSGAMRDDGTALCFAQARELETMKMFVGFGLFFWFLCGLIGAWMLEGRHNMHLKSIARGPITLVHAFNENPVTLPGP